MTNRRTARLATIAVVLWVSSVAVGQAAAGQKPSPPLVSHPPLITRHNGIFNGKQLEYTATVEGIDVPDAKGKHGARVVTFAYTAEGIGDKAKRPVMFVFNGGPITASLWLHIGVIGPKRVLVPDDLTADPNTFGLVDNV